MELSMSIDRLDEENHKLKSLLIDQSQPNISSVYKVANGISEEIEKISRLKEALFTDAK